MNKATHILLVDDDPAILDIFSQILQAQGYQVSRASTGQEGLEATRQKHPDLVLLDVNLPDLNGVEVCRQIKADATLPDVFVVLFSGEATSTANKVDGLTTGADEYIVKSLDTEELLARIRTLVRLRDATAALRASEQHYRRLVEILPDGVCLIDLEARLASVNSQAVAMLGFDRPEELLGNSILSLSPPEDHERLSAGLATTLSAGVVRNVEYSMFNKAGQRFPVEMNATVLRNSRGQPRAVLGVVRDISSRKRSEEQIRLLADAVQSIQELVCITDSENRFTFVNKAFLETYGYTEQEVLGRKVDMLYSPKNPPGLTDQMFQQTLAGGWKGELLDLKKDGTEFPISLATSQIKDGTGRTLGLIGVARDISEQKRAEKQAAIFSQLGYRLSVANTPGQAADIILDIAAALFGWDAADIHLYSSADDRLVPVLALGAVAGGRRPIPPSTLALDPLMRLVMKKGARLSICQAESSSAAIAPLPGDAPAGPASRMHVPIRSSGEVLGVLSIHSDKPRAYCQQDLSLLQTVADHCGDAFKRIEVTEALGQAEARYRSIFEHATEGIFRSTPEGRLVSANPALARIFGYKSPEEMMALITDIGRQLYIKPEQRAELKRLLETKDEIQAFEAQNRRKNGALIWISLNGHIIRDAAGAVISYEGTIQDITERKWAESLLQVQRDLSLFLSSTDDLRAGAEHLLKVALSNEGIDCGAMYLVNPATGALELVAHEGLSARFAKRGSRFPTAASPSKLKDKGRGGFDLEAASPLAGIVRALRQERLLALEAIPIHYSGQVVAVLTFGSHLHRDIPGRSCRTIDAITAQAGGAVARISAERSLRANRELLEKTLHSLRSAVLVVDVATNIIQDCNPAATRIFGYTRDELVGQNTTFLHLDETLSEQFRTHVNSALKTKGYLEGFEFRLKRKNGEPFPTEHTVMPIRNEAGRLVNWVSNINDISERKQTEAELRRLPQRIIEAQEAERLRVARELHDGVNQIIASAKMRLRKVQDLSATLSPAAREILIRCDKLLVQALEENRRIAHNLRPSVLDDLGLVAACQTLCRELQLRTNLTVKCSIADLGRRLPPTVELNLFRIVQEALNNLEKHAHARTVQLRLTAQDDSILLRIQDDGRGFDLDSAANKAQRRGIGLTNMRERAAALGGVCEVKSIPRQGTSLMVRIPLPPGTASGSEKKPTA
jgi:two-component system sensor histidine kinase NreB